MNFVIYLPAFNCSGTLAAVIDEIPGQETDDARLLIVDNASIDGTAEVALKLAESSRWRGRLTLLRSPSNSGYAGSQKLAYRYIRSFLRPDAVVMLHADGQYPAALLGGFKEALRNGADVAYGFRSPSHFGCLEETPLKARLAMALLNRMECVATGRSEVREWHSGYVGYSLRFLDKVNFDAVTSTRHIDGNLLFAASSLGFKLSAIPIYKRYKAYKGFTGVPAYLYILQCLALMCTMRRTAARLKCRDPLWAPDPGTYEVVLKGSH